jgi:hypothetical protein
MPLGSLAVVPEVGHCAGDRRWLRGGDGMEALLARWAAAQDARGRRWMRGALGQHGPDLGPLGLIWGRSRGVSSRSLAQHGNAGGLAPAVGGARAQLFLCLVFFGVSW